MEKYDRDVEQKQHELDVLKVCISHFMLVSKRSARARARTLYPPPRPPYTPPTIALAMLAMNHFRVASSLFFKARRKAKLLI